MKDEIIMNPDRNCSPHVVLIGSGASRAAFPNGDANRKALPLMDDLVEVLELKPLLENSNIDPARNFESIYSGIKDKELKEKIEEKIFCYFDSLTLPENATLYDKLLLSLRSKDAIFTFNWDPFLFDAYCRNRDTISSLPNIFFLHGNVRIGACNNCDAWGGQNKLCLKCNKNLTAVPLLYPIENKNYFASNHYTASCWKKARRDWFSSAFTVTIFGYSAPDSDIEAMSLIEKAWFQKIKREFPGHVEVIDIICPDQLYQRWKALSPNYHILTPRSFEDSFIWKWPRRSCEALRLPITQGIPCEEFPLVVTDDLKILQDSILEIVQYED